MSAPTLVTVDDVRAAADRLRGSIMRTPLIPAPWADPQRPLWIKPESLQELVKEKHREILDNYESDMPLSSNNSFMNTELLDKN